MSISSTYLSGAVNATQTSFGVNSATSITAGSNVTGLSLTYLQIDTEMMVVVGVSGTVISVLRGQLGTMQASHLASAPIVVGSPTDFASFIPSIAAFRAFGNRNIGWGGPVASAATITAPSQRFHVIGTVTITTMLPPTNFVEGEVVIVFDNTSSTTVTSTGGTAPWTFSVATELVAVGAVTYYYDAGAASPAWYPSRVL